MTINKYLFTGDNHSAVKAGWQRNGNVGCICGAQKPRDVMF